MWCKSCFMMYCSYSLAEGSKLFLYCLEVCSIQLHEKTKCSALIWAPSPPFKSLHPHSHTWRWWGTAIILTPVFDIFLSHWVPFLCSTRSCWLPLFVSNGVEVPPSVAVWGLCHIPCGPYCPGDHLLCIAIFITTGNCHAVKLNILYKFSPRFLI